MRQLSELLMSTTVSRDIVTILNSNSQTVRGRDFDFALHRPDGSERELKLEASLGYWHKVRFVANGDSYWLRVRTYPHLRTQLELPIGLAPEL